MKNIFIFLAVCLLGFQVQAQNTILGASGEDTVRTNFWQQKTNADRFLEGLNKNGTVPLTNNAILGRVAKSSGGALTNATFAGTVAGTALTNFIQSFFAPGANITFTTNGNGSMIISSTGGGGAQSPLTNDLDAAGFAVTNAVALRLQGGTELTSDNNRLLGSTYIDGDANVGFSDNAGSFHLFAGGNAIDYTPDGQIINSAFAPDTIPIISSSSLISSTVPIEWNGTIYDGQLTDTDWTTILSIDLNDDIFDQYLFEFDILTQWNDNGDPFFISCFKNVASVSWDFGLPLVTVTSTNLFSYKTDIGADFRYDVSGSTVNAQIKSALTNTFYRAHFRKLTLRNPS